MAQAPNEVPKRGRGGDQHTPQAKVQIAQREEQIVQLRLRRIPFSAIARTVGVNKSNAVRSFYRALRRNTDQDIQSHHRQELADLEMEQAKYWSIIDAHKDNWKAQIAALRSLNMVHVRRARLLGLDAEETVTVRGIYNAGTNELSDERLENERVWRALPIDDQIRIFEALTRPQPAIETTAAQVNSESDQRPGDDPDDADPSAA
jgi:hypothetical protein